MEKISIQEIWSPPGKEFPKVITTPEQTKYHLYKDQAELSSHLKVSSEATIDWFDTTNRQGKEIRRIRNVIVNGKPVIAQESEGDVKPDTGGQPAKKYGRDEDRTDQRTFVMEVGQDLRAGLRDEKHPFAKAREVIMASWINGKVEAPKIPAKIPQLNLNMDWLSESIKRIWPDKSTNHFAEFLIQIYGIDKAKGIDLMLKQLSQKQQADLCGKLTEMLEKL